MKRTVLLFFALAAPASIALPPSAPEIDAASAGSAIALVSGMVLMFRARRAK